MINKIKYILAVLVLLPFFSCNEWLKVSPANKVDGRVLLTNTEGFNAALGGVYSALTENSLYGASLQFEVIDVMAGYWQITPEHNLYPYMQYNYKDAKVTAKINGIWTSMYAAIAQCNHIIESLDYVNREDVEYYDIIKGEAYGLRAFLHMEVLKMFGPAIALKSDMDKKAIPYRTKFDKHAIEFDTYTKVLDLARQDLIVAAEAMTNDPIDQLGREGNANISNLLNYNGILDYRGARMNKYAAYALLARLELMAGNKTKALEYANLFVEPQGSIPFRFTRIEEIAETGEELRNLKFSPEIIFSLYINKHYENTGALFGFESYTIENKSVLYPDIKNYRDFYTVGKYASASDYRYKFWFTNLGDKVVYSKYRKPNVGGTLEKEANKPEVSLLRFTELYYIAAECNIGVNNVKALNLINTVRTTRGLDAVENITDETQLMDLLVNEQQKEYFGEGKMFFIYKRLYQNIKNIAGVETSASQTVFVFPIPDNEYEFSPNEKPVK